MGKRWIFDRDTQKLIPAEEYYARSHRGNQTHAVIQDSCDAFLSHADGKMYDSKSEYRKELKRRGLVELGNELPKPRKKHDYSDVEQSVVQAFEMHGR